MKNLILSLVLACAWFPLCVMGGPAGTDSFPEILLCIDAPHKSATEKLVYAYVDGVKTGCMTLENLYAFIDASRARKDSAALENRNNDARKVQLPVGGDIVDLIAAGKKDLAGVDLHGRDLIGLNLSSADLSGANLESADLRGGKLKGVILRNANLKDVFLRSADLRGADLTGANLESVIFTNADLRGATGLTIKTIGKIRNLSHAKLDTLLDRDAKEEYPEKFDPPRKCWDNDWARNYDCGGDSVESDQ